MPMPRDYVRLDEEQFAKLVELLTPGYELAKAYMAASQPPTQEVDPDGKPATGDHPEDERATSADDESQKGGG